MANTIILKSKTTTGAPVPGDLSQGELAINLLDEKLYSKNSSDAIFEIGAGGVQTPWAQNIDAAGFDLTDVGLLQVAGQTIAEHAILETNDANLGFPRAVFTVGSSDGDSITNAAVWFRPDITTGNKQVSMEALDQKIVGSSTNRFGISINSTIAKLASSMNLGSTAGPDIGITTQGITSTDYDIFIDQNTRVITFGGDLRIADDMGLYYGDSQEARSIWETSGNWIHRQESGDYKWQLAGSDMMKLDHTNNLLQIREAYKIRFLDSLNTSYVDMGHDTTDFNIEGVSTVAINITGITSIQAGTVDADFDSLTATDFNAVALTAAGAATNFLAEDGTYIVPAGTGIGGSITDNQIAVGASAANTIEGTSGFTWDGSSFILDTASAQIRMQAIGLVSTGAAGYGIYYTDDQTWLDQYPGFVNESDQNFTLSDFFGVYYTWASTTANTDPGPGFMKFDDVAASVTRIYVDDIDHNGHSNDNVFNKLTIGDVIMVRNGTDRQPNWIGVLNTAPQDNTGWWTLHVTTLASNGTFSNSCSAQIQCIYAANDTFYQDTDGAGFDLTGLGSVTATDFNGVALTAAGSASNFLTEAGTYVAGGGTTMPTGADGLIPYYDTGGGEYLLDADFKWDDSARSLVIFGPSNPADFFSFGHDGSKCQIDAGGSTAYEFLGEGIEALAGTSHFGILNIGRVDKYLTFADDNGTSFDISQGAVLNRIALTDIDLYIEAGGFISLFDSGGSDQMAFQHDGTDSVMNNVNSGSIRMQDNSSGGISIKLEERASAAANTTGFGQIWVDSTDELLKFTTESGVEYDLTEVGGGGGVDTFEGRSGTVVADAADYADILTIYTADQTISGSASLVMLDDREIRWGAGPDIIMDYTTSTEYFTINSGSLSNGIVFQDTAVDKIFINMTNSRVELRDAFALRFYNSADTASVELDFDGTNFEVNLLSEDSFIVTEAGTTKFGVNHFSNRIDIHDGYELYIRAPDDFAWVLIDHDGVDGHIGTGGDTPGSLLFDSAVAYEKDIDTVSSNAVSLDMNGANGFFVDLEPATAAVIITLSGGPPSDTYYAASILVKQDGTTAQTISFAGGTIVPQGGTLHPVTTTLDGTSIYSVETWDGGAIWYITGADYS